MNSKELVKNWSFLIDNQRVLLNIVFLVCFIIIVALMKHWLYVIEFSFNYFGFSFYSTRILGFILLDSNGNCQ